MIKHNPKLIESFKSHMRQMLEQSIDQQMSQEIPDAVIFMGGTNGHN